MLSPWRVNRHCHAGGEYEPTDAQGNHAAYDLLSAVPVELAQGNAAAVVELNVQVLCGVLDSVSGVLGGLRYERHDGR
jgi:hypothetical protein